MPTISLGDLRDMEAYSQSNSVEPVLMTLLQRLMIERPKDVTGFALAELASIHQVSEWVGSKLVS